MNKVIRFIQNYLVFGFILSFLFFISIVISEKLSSQNALLEIFSSNLFFKYTQEILSWNLMLWFVTLILFLIMLVVVPAARESTLKRIANLKERDEREIHITGKASRATYISTLSLMIFLLFISVFSIHINHFKEPQGTKKYHWSVAANVGFSFFDKKENPPITKDDEYIKSEVFNSEKITPSKSAMILILLVWQLLTFNITARKEQ